MSDQAVFMAAASGEHLPLMEGKQPASGTMFYVCSNKTCRKPVASDAEALIQINTFTNNKI